MADAANQNARTAFELGQQAFERGRYAEAVKAFEQGIAEKPSISLDGELKLWLVNALAATDRRQEAVELCGKLARHPDLDVRKESKRVLYIINAPKLEAKEECLTKIPDLADLGNSDEKPWQNRPAKPRPPKPSPPPLPLSEVNTEDNGFVWFALLLAAVLVGGLWWFS